MYILAIESSCDDTSIAIFQDDKLIAMSTAHQVVHSKLGGVVPELASREHLAFIVPTVEDCLNKSDIQMKDLSAIGVTRGPGLMGSLLVGVSFAKGLAAALDIPLIEVHHMHAHIMSNFIDAPKPAFPFINLTVSGGHTDLYLVESPLNYSCIGTSLDDAAGEAFDKIGKMLGLSYPAGPEIDALAQQGQAKYDFPIARVGTYEFSFSGLKTSVLRFLQSKLVNQPNFIKENLHDICASVQSNIVTTLIQKLEYAIKEYDVREVAIAGGVSANSELRKAVQDMAHKHKLNYYLPAMTYCTDNAAMIGLVAYHKFKDGLFSDLSMAADPRLQYHSKIK